MSNILHVTDNATTNSRDLLRRHLAGATMHDAITSLQHDALTQRPFNAVPYQALATLCQLIGTPSYRKAARYINRLCRVALFVSRAADPTMHVQLTPPRPAAPCSVCDTLLTTDLNVWHGRHACPACNAIHGREIARIGSATRRAVSRGVPATLTVRQWLTTLRYFDYKCVYCAAPFETLDHITPVSAGGGTTQSNCIPCCADCNERKQAIPVRDVYPFVVGKLARFQKHIATADQQRNVYRLSERA